jgi:hypothetical protein
MPTNLIEESFHNEIDTNVHAYQTYQPKSGWVTNPATLLTTYSLNLTYQFHPHFHPYVLQLARELSDTDSVFDLLAMNVLYQQTDSNGSLEAIPNSTGAVLFSLPPKHWTRIKIPCWPVHRLPCRIRTHPFR